MEKITQLYQRWCGVQPTETICLGAAGSNRQYIRFMGSDGTSVIGCIGTNREENHAFISISRHFAALGLPVPEILAVDEDEMRYLQTDLGDVSLYDAVRKGREAGGNYSPQEVELLRKAIRKLPELQFRGAKGLDWNVCFPQPSFDRRNVFFDLNYFKYCFLKPAGVEFPEVRLEEDFEHMAADLLAEPWESFMYRDFQARNVMVNSDGDPFFIDFQGGRCGPYYYDLASFLWQAPAKYSDELRCELIEDYYDALQEYTEVPSMAHFMERLYLFVLFRTLQVFGAYGFRGLIERKQMFIDAIPDSIVALRQLLETPFPYPHLMEALNCLTEIDWTAKTSS